MGRVIFYLKSSLFVNRTSFQNCEKVVPVPRKIGLKLLSLNLFRMRKRSSNFEIGHLALADLECAGADAPPSGSRLPSITTSHLLILFYVIHFRPINPKIVLNPFSAPRCTNSEGEHPPKKTHFENFFERPTPLEKTNNVIFPKKKNFGSFI